GSPANPINIPDDPLIVDDNGGVPIVIDDADETRDNGKTIQRRLRRQLANSPSNNSIDRTSGDLVDWTTEGYKKQCETKIFVEWKNVLEQWAVLCELKMLCEIEQSEAFRVAMREACRVAQEGISGFLGTAGTLCEEWKSLESELLQRLQTKSDKITLRRFGRALLQLHEAETERLGVEIAMSDGNNDGDYEPSSRCR
ncbi:hypothetical protein DM02DRAFT_101888, partial [Periconia macrospinosa]